MTKKLLAMGLCAVLMLLTAVSVAAQEESVIEWTYYNSVVVFVTSDTPRTFTADDFPEVDCQKVCVVEKRTSDEHKVINYTVVLVLNESGNEAMNRAVEILQNNPLVHHAERNDEHEQCEHRIILTHQNCVLRLGEMVDIEVKEFIRPYTYQEFLGIYVTVDRSKFDDSAQVIQENFAQLGILEFWADWASYQKTQKGVPSEDGKYYVAFNPEMTRYDLIDRIANHPGIREVYMDWRYHPPGSWVFTETWSIDNPALAELSLSGGYVSKGHLLEQTATIRALRPGTITLTHISDRFSEVEQTCEITILNEYTPGDVTMDAHVNAVDALRVLQHAVEKITLNQEEISLADLDGNGEIDAGDALMILKKAVRKL